MQKVTSQLSGLLPPVEGQLIKWPKPAYWLLLFPGMGFMAFGSLTDLIKSENLLSFSSFLDLYVLAAGGYFFARDLLRLFKHHFGNAAAKA